MRPVSLYKNTQVRILKTKILCSEAPKSHFRTPMKGTVGRLRRLYDGGKDGGFGIPRQAFQFPRIVKDLCRPHVGRDRPTPCLFGSLHLTQRQDAKNSRCARNRSCRRHFELAPPLERQCILSPSSCHDVPSGKGMESAGLAYDARASRCVSSLGDKERRPTWGRMSAHCYDCRARAGDGFWGSTILQTCQRPRTEKAPAGGPPASS